MGKRLGEFGRFHGVTDFNWSDDGNRIVTCGDVIYEDPKGKVWAAPRGTVVDGSNVPIQFWTLLGSPFLTDCRLAVTIHGVQCEERQKPFEDVHLMFYWACRYLGMEPIKAKSLYYGVYWFGPHWNRKGELANACVPTLLDTSLALEYARETDGIEVNELVRLSPWTLRQLHATKQRNK